MINRPLVIKFACGLTFLVSVIVEMYALLVWAGGNAIDWLVPAKLERWTTVSMEPQLFIVLISAGLVALMSILGFVPRIQQLVYSGIGSNGLYLSSSPWEFISSGLDHESKNGSGKIQILLFQTHRAETFVTFGYLGIPQSLANYDFYVNDFKS